MGCERNIGDIPSGVIKHGGPLENPRAIYIYREAFDAKIISK